MDLPEVRYISEAQARTEILDLLKTHPQMDSFDLAIALSLDLDFADQVCEALLTEGVLELTPKADL